ncbi:MAG: hypothetical protein BAA01_12680 [Bacillus thermozeamaize]|uniref:Type III restriction enzyme C-terminal endonuclease domain-containing protein n=1 Tax=Bacillus thermozeamaize TaxID=230954 RepID=A0A1Y3PK42_9BACI|nr:MAG: hypothetical protein BAA01_12680 [Bacillus thermozeamaize]
MIELVKTIYVAGKAGLTEDERSKNIEQLKPNQNFYKKEFQDLWNQINKKTVYTVQFDSEELIRKCIDALDQNLHVPSVRYAIKHGELHKIESKEQLEQGEAFVTRETQTEYVHQAATSKIKYELVGKLMDETRLTRKTIVKILTGIKSSTFHLFRINPEEFIIRAKLPRGFFIPTPLGNYNPDWAIVFKEGEVKTIFFIAETKGSMESLELREVEKAKIECARRHFAKLNTGRLKYDVVNSYEKLMEIVKSSIL